MDQPAPGGTDELVIAQASISSADLIQALGSLGISADQVSVNPAVGLQRFVIRLDPNGQPLPSLAAIDQMIASACVAPGALQGAQTLLLGAMQQNGDQLRVTAWTVDVASGEIQATNLADGTPATLADTVRSALGGLPIALPGG